MIQADFLVCPDGALHGVRITGHAMFGPYGNDIVCAAVSSAAYLVVNTITDVYHRSPLVLRADDGAMLLRLQEQDVDVCKELLQGLKLHLLGLEEQYENEIKVGYMEV